MFPIMRRKEKLATFMQWTLKTNVVVLCNNCYSNSTIQNHLEAYKAISLHNSREHYVPCVLCLENSFGYISIKITLYKLD